MTVQFRTLPQFGGDPRAVAEIVNGIMNGKTNNTGVVTLATAGLVGTARLLLSLTARLRLLIQRLTVLFRTPLTRLPHLRLLPIL
jgi:hypothetical protein